MATVAATSPRARAADILDDAFRRDVLAGLASGHKAIPARWFYDRRGSELFEEITRLPEYYPTGAEIEILTRHGAEIGSEVGSGRAVIEFGAGSATKTPLLLDHIAPACYVPVDISGEFLRESCKVLAQRYSRLPILPVEGDFTRPVSLPAAAHGDGRLGFFPGSTIGNLGPADAVDLLRVMRATLGQGDGREALLVIGMDLVKDRDVLIRAYDDAAGVTARFNLNLAERINRELGGTIPIEALHHRAIWNEPRARIEMHLEARRAIDFEVAGRHFSMAAGESIHTENSHKYEPASAAMLLLAGGWEPLRQFTDAGERFMVMIAAAEPDRLSRR
ncbi:MAG: L-histidine N(alpha)-methyltransferase [Novosphingobium sp.]